MHARLRGGLGCSVSVSESSGLFQFERWGLREIFYRNMKYRFAGNVDVPEWILSEVGTLSKISCVRLKLITRQLITQLAGGVLDVEKVTKLVGDKAGFTWSDIKAALAAISFILRGAVRFDVDEGTLRPARPARAPLPLCLTPAKIAPPPPCRPLTPTPTPPPHPSCPQRGAAAAGPPQGELGRRVPSVPHPPRAAARAGGL